MQESQKMRVSITTGSIVRVVAVVALALGVFLLKDILLAVLASIVIASAIEPAVRLLTRFRIPRVAAVVLIYGVLVACAAIFFYFIMPVLIQEILSLTKTLPEFIGSLDIKNTDITSLENILRSLSLSDTFGEYFTGITSALAVFGSSPIQVATYLFGGMTALALIVVLSFYLSAQKDGVGDFLRTVTPIKYEPYVIGLWRRSQRNIGRWMQGQLMLGVLVGVFVFIGLHMLGIRHALLLAIISAIFEIIPVFGPILGALPAIAVAFVDGGVSLSLLVSGLYVVVQQLESNVIYPLVVKKVIGVPPIIVIIALVAGLSLAGFIGVIVSVPLATVLMEYLNDRERSRRIASE